MNKKSSKSLTLNLAVFLGIVISLFLPVMGRAADTLIDDPALKPYRKTYREKRVEYQSYDIKQLLKAILLKEPTIGTILSEYSGELMGNVGKEKYRMALVQLLLFCESWDSECKTALKIINDSVPRGGNGSNIDLDGYPEDWLGVIPNPQTRVWQNETEDNSRQVWGNGAAGVVRDEKIYLLIGLSDKAYFEKPGNFLEMVVDCFGGPRVDAALKITKNGNDWSCMCNPLNFSIDFGGEIKKVSGRIGSVIEIEITPEKALPVNLAKPVWTLQMMVRSEVSGRYFKPRTRDIPIFNESSGLGAVAKPYVYNLFYLAAEEGLKENDRLAAAIAITSAFIAEGSDDKVRQKLRQDNSAFLKFGRELGKWQEDNNLEFVLEKYPLEALLAWSNRLYRQDLRYLAWNRNLNSLNDLSDYDWSFVSVETLRELKTLAESQKLVGKSCRETGRLIDEFVGKNFERRLTIAEMLQNISREKDPKARKKWETEYQNFQKMRNKNEDLVDYFKGEPVYESESGNSSVILKVFQKRGKFVGGSPDRSQISGDFLRALGIAPIEMVVSPSRDRMTIGRDHRWTAFYDNFSSTWRSIDNGRNGEKFWWFYLPRIPVFPYAVFATRDLDLQKLPFPQFFVKELKGRNIEKLSQNGIRTKEIREWMLTPCFGY